VCGACSDWIEAIEGGFARRDELPDLIEDDWSFFSLGDGSCEYRW